MEKQCVYSLLLIHSENTVNTDTAQPNKHTRLSELKQKVDAFFKRVEGQKRISPEDQSTFLTELNHRFLEIVAENEELNKTTRELKLSRDHYHLYYDLNPSACFSFNDKGLILEANLAASKLLNVGRHNLRDQQHSFTAHLSSSSYETFFGHLEKTLSEDSPQECTLHILQIGTKNSIPAKLHSRRVKQLSGSWECLTFVQQQAEEEL